jgi:hypothetical protein
MAGSTVGLLTPVNDKGDLYSDQNNGGRSRGGNSFNGRWFRGVEGEHMGGYGDGGDDNREGWEADWAGVGGGGNTRLWLAEGPHGRFPMWVRLPAPSIRTLRVGASTGLLVILLGSKPRSRFIGRVGVSLILAPAPQVLSWALLGSPVKILLPSKYIFRLKNVTLCEDDMWDSNHR